MRILFLMALLGACTTSSETQYPNSSGPMGVGSNASGVETPENDPEDTGNAEQSDTGQDTGRT